MTREELIDRLSQLRDQWRAVRSDRLKRKTRLMSENMDRHEVRRDHEYRRLKKEQHMISVRIKHGEQKLNRMMARGDKKE